MTSLETLSESGKLVMRRGKVRDIYDLGDDRLLIVASDRISAFDWVLPDAIPDKGRVLTALSVFWFGRIETCRNHLISDDIGAAGLDLSSAEQAALKGRSMIVRKADVVPFECVVRGYLSGMPGASTAPRHGLRREAAGRAPRERPDRTVCSPRPPRPSRATTRMSPSPGWPRRSARTGPASSPRLSTEVYRHAAEYALDRGLILADTKFEWGYDRRTGELLLVDEVLTPDSSRYWPKDGYAPGGPQPSFDKQYVRDWLESTGWDKASSPPSLPADVVARTRDKYVDAYEILTGQSFPWKSATPALKGGACGSNPNSL